MATPLSIIIPIATGAPLCGPYLPAYVQMEEGDHLYVVVDTTVVRAAAIVLESLSLVPGCPNCTILATGRRHNDQFATARNLALSEVESDWERTLLDDPLSGGNWVAYLDEDELCLPVPLAALRETIQTGPDRCGLHVFWKDRGPELQLRPSSFLHRIRGGLPRWSSLGPAPEAWTPDQAQLFFREADYVLGQAIWHQIGANA